MGLTPPFIAPCVVFVHSHLPGPSPCPGTYACRYTDLGVFEAPVVRRETPVHSPVPRRVHLQRVRPARGRRVVQVVWVSPRVQRAGCGRARCILGPHRRRHSAHARWPKTHNSHLSILSIILLPRKLKRFCCNKRKEVQLQSIVAMPTEMLLLYPCMVLMLKT